MDRWDVLLAGVAGYLAVISLVRLMTRRRNQLIKQVHRVIEEQRGNQPKADAKPGSDDTDREVA